jgi:DNA-directed RNA polymerase subunit beta'
VLVNGLAIRLHPLVCKAFNADFDGDKMAVHLPLSMEAQIEARMLMSSVNNIFSPANGEPAIIPTQDIVFGIYYLTKDNPDAEHNRMMFADVDETRAAYDNEIIKEHTKIKVRIDGEIVETTTGRIIFKEILPCGFPFSLINKTIKGNEIRDIIKYIYKEFGKQDTVDFLNRLMNLGFDYATKSGLSICLDDIIVPLWKEAIIEDARKKAWEYYKPSNNEDEDENVSAMIDRKPCLMKSGRKRLN